MTMTVIVRVLVCSLAMVLPVQAEAQGARLAPAAARALAARSRQSLASALARDARNHAVAPVRRLARGRTVHRFTTLAEARSALTAGIPANRHMTSRALRGRPPTPETAMRTLGLPTRPEARLTIWLRPGQPVIMNKVQGGAAGRGEIVSPVRIAKEQIRRWVRLPASQ